MAVPGAHIQPVPLIAVIAGERDRLSVPPPIANPAHVNIERPARQCRHVGQSRAVGREHWIEVYLLIVSQRMRLAHAHVENLQLDTLQPVFGRVDDPSSIRRECRRRVISPVVGQLGGGAAGRIDFPDGALHRHRDPFAVGRPRRRPGRGARRGRQVVILHVIGIRVDIRSAGRGHLQRQLCRKRSQQEVDNHTCNRDI